MNPSEYMEMTFDKLNEELEKGGKFVMYTYAVSILIMTFRQPSEQIYFIRHDESAIKHGWPYLLLSLFLGWWGIPWGPIYTIQSIFYAFVGKDVTAEVVSRLNAQYAEDLTQLSYAEDPGIRYDAQGCSNLTVR